MRLSNGKDKASMTYSLVARATESGTSIEPVIVAQFVNLDALLVGGLMRHGLCHHQRLGLSLDSEVRIRGQIRGNFEMLLQGQLRWFVGSQNRKRRHDSCGCAQIRRDRWTMSGYPDDARCEVQDAQRLQGRNIMKTERVGAYRCAAHGSRVDVEARRER